MEFKFDTREKLHAISILESDISANMTDDLQQHLLPYLEKDVKNVVLNLGRLNTLDPAAAQALVNIQQEFYDRKASFVICGLSKTLENSLDEMGLLELMNCTPTESEASDIVQMEEIEREFLEEEGAE